jgi:SNF2 family DNA or RNA helicase
MGEGLNLQKNPEHWPGGASYGIFLDLWWSPARNEQCIKRIHRQGSNIPVFIYELQNVPSVDQFIKAKNEEKNEQFNSIMESKEIRPASEWKKILGG